MSRYATVDKRLEVFVNQKGYEVWKNKQTGKLDYAHRILMRLFGYNIDGKQIHHKNHKLDNRANWLQVTSDKEHRILEREKRLLEKESVNSE